MNVEKRQRIERRIAREAIKGLLFPSLTARKPY